MLAGGHGFGTEPPVTYTRSPEERFQTQPSVTGDGFHKRIAEREGPARHRGHVQSAIEYMLGVDYSEAGRVERHGR